MERQENFLVLFHPLPYVPPAQLLTRYPDLLFLDVQDMVSAGCSTLVSVRLLFNMHFYQHRSLGRNWTYKCLIWSMGVIALARLPP